MDSLKRQKYVGRQISREEALAGIEVCKYCELPQAPRKLPDKYFHEEFCWRLRAPGSSLEAADMRECLDRLYARQNATQALLSETSERYLQTIHGLEARVEKVKAELEVSEAYGSHVDGELERVQDQLQRVYDDFRDPDLKPDNGCTQPGSAGVHEGDPCVFCGFRCYREG